MAISAAVFALPVRGSIPLLMLALGLFIASNLALGITFSTIATQPDAGDADGAVHAAAVDPALGLHVPVPRHAGAGRNGRARSSRRRMRCASCAACCSRATASPRSCRSSGRSRSSRWRSVRSRSGSIARRWIDHRHVRCAPRRLRAARPSRCGSRRRVGCGGRRGRLGRFARQIEHRRDDMGRQYPLARKKAEEAAFLELGTKRVDALRGFAAIDLGRRPGGRRIGEEDQARTPSVDGAAVFERGGRGRRNAGPHPDRCRCSRGTR